MNEREAVEALSALAQETRLRVFRLLVRAGRDGLPAGAIGEAVGASSSNLSFHLSQLEGAGLIARRREARSIIYSLREDVAGGLIAFLREDSGLGEGGSLPGQGEAQRGAALEAAGAGDPRNVLFLCSGNSARSIMAEAILRKDGGGRFRAFSAGSKPRGAVDPLALEVLAAHNYPVDGLVPKDWRVFAESSSPRIDVALTICDVTAGEQCPHWPGEPVSGHWGIADPAAVTELPGERRAAFIRAFRYLRRRIAAFLALPLDDLDPIALTQRLAEIGTMEGASIRAIAPLRPAARKIRDNAKRKAS